MILSKEQQEYQKKVNMQKIDLQLVGLNYAQYQNCPESYILERIRMDSPWPETSQQEMLVFLKSISNLYNPVPYHNLTHAFDVMAHLDLFLTAYGWQNRLEISHHKRIFMLIAAYAHDTGHQGLTNAFYKNANHPLASYSQSPLQYMHASNLRRLLRQHKLEVSIHILEQLTQMILRTDNYYHGWLLERGGKLKGESDLVLREQKNSLTVYCLLLHAADLNNTCKDTQLNIMWTQLLYQQFQQQNKFQIERGMKASFTNLSSATEKANSNIYFLEILVLPMFKCIADLEPRFGELVKKVCKNKVHWQSLIKSG